MTCQVAKKRGEEGMMKTQFRVRTTGRPEIGLRILLVILLLCRESFVYTLFVSSDHSFYLIETSRCTGAKMK